MSYKTAPRTRTKIVESEILKEGITFEYVSPLSFNVYPNKTYILNAFLRIGSYSSTGGGKIAFSSTATKDDFLIYANVVDDPFVSLGTVHGGVQTNYDVTIVQFDNSFSASIWLTGFATFTNEGVIDIRFAQKNLDSGSGGSYVSAASYFSIIEL